MRSRTLTHILVPLCLALTVLAVSQFWFSTIDYQGKYEHVDLEHYRKMAQSAPALNTTVIAPPIYRIFSPWIVGTLFSNDVFGFRVLTIITMMLVAVQLWRLLLLYKVSQKSAVACTLLSVLNPYISGLTLFDYFQLCDALSLLFILLMMEALTQRNLIVYGAVLLIGSLTREVSLLMIAVALIIGVRSGQKRFLIHIGVASIPALAAFVTIRSILHPPNVEWSLAHQYIQNLHMFISPVVWTRMIFNTFTPVALVPLVFWKESALFFREYKHWLLLLLLIFFSTFFSGEERLFAPALGVVYILCARIFDEYELLRNKLFVTILILSALLTSTHFLVTDWSLRDKVVYYAGSIIIECILAGTAYWLTSRQRALPSG